MKWRHAISNLSDTLMRWTTPQKVLDARERLAEKEGAVLGRLYSQGLLDGYAELDNSYKDVVDKARKDSGSS